MSEEYKFVFLLQRNFKHEKSMLLFSYCCFYGKDEISFLFFGSSIASSNLVLFLIHIYMSYWSQEDVLFDVQT